MTDCYDSKRPRKGRGALSNDDGRFEPYQHVRVDDGWAPQRELGSPFKTTVTVDTSQSILARNQSPDVPFEQSVNPYRGCEHGCVYCFARPTHTYLGWSAGLDFETKLLAKPNAPTLLRTEIGRRAYRCQVLAVGTNTDPYQPIERRYRIMRGILELLAAIDHPVCITTKSSLVERDIDLLAPMAKRRLASISISLTTFDHQLARRLEPRATAPRRRLETIRRLAGAGIPVNVSVAPIVPVLADSELETVIAAAADAGAVSASYILLRLPREVNGLFQEWLAAYYPHRAEHVMSIIRQIRGGNDNDPRFGTRKRGTGVFADLIANRFALALKRCGLDRSLPPLTTELFTTPASADRQLALI
jgi:DNA repair photolyase